MVNSLILIKATDVNKAKTKIDVDGKQANERVSMSLFMKSKQRPV